MCRIPFCLPTATDGRMERTERNGMEWHGTAWRLWRRSRDLWSPFITSLPLKSRLFSDICLRAFALNDIPRSILKGSSRQLNGKLYLIKVVPRVGLKVPFWILQLSTTSENPSHIISSNFSSRHSQL